MRIFFWIPLAFLLLQSTFCAIEVDALKLNLISDIHFDPYYGTFNGFLCKDATDSPMGTRSCDAPRGLVNSLLRDLSEQDADYTFLMGDMQRHDFDPKSMLLKDSVGYILESLGKMSAPDTPRGRSVLVAMGNNDFVPNYSFDVTEPGPFFKEVVELFNNTVLYPGEVRSFAKCAYYSRIISAELRVIVLNTLLWAHALSPPLPADELHDPCGQLSFLRTQLAEARGGGGKAIILSHIPPYPDVWKAIRKGEFEKSEYYKAKYHRKFSALIKEFSDTINLQFYGHVHLFSFQAVAGGVPSYIIPAVSPLYNNKPSYIVADIDEFKGTLRSMFQRYLSKEKDDTYEWKVGFKVEDVMGDLNNVTSLRDAAAQLLVDDTKWNAYLAIRSGGLANNSLFPEYACNAWCRAAISCSMRFEDVQEINECLTSAINTTSLASKVAVGFALLLEGIAVFGFLAFGVYYINHYMKSKKRRSAAAMDYGIAQNITIHTQGEERVVDSRTLVTKIPE